jgi:Transcriptional regulator containing an amidase domain and an AraC-type DNA-binding HTH domain
MNRDSSPVERDILIVACENGLLLEATGVADVFSTANELAPAGSRPYALRIATAQPHRVVHGRSGLNLLADSCLTELRPSVPRDTIMVTGRGGSPEEREALSSWIKAAAPRARRVVSVCAGAFVLAQAGLLDGLRATTHWKTLDELAARYPKVEVQRGPIYVRDGKVWTSAGASSGFDLSLALVEDDLGFAVAKAVAQHLVMFLRRPGGQSQFSSYLAAQASSEGPIQELQSWAIEHLAADLSVEAMASRAAMSPRNFARVFSKETGCTPARFVEGIRLEAARQRLEMGDESVEQVAAACGLGNALALRRAFERELGVSPSDYRARFGRL